MSFKATGILLLSSGQKVAHARIAQEAAHARGLVLHASDRRANVPARLVADRFITFDDAEPTEWIQQIRSYCLERKIGLIIPTRHSELTLLAANASLFSDANIAIALSSPPAIKSCCDKLKTFQHLTAAGISTPPTFLPEDFSPNPDFNYIAKPRFGAASAGLTFFRGDETPCAFPPDTIIQPIAPGQEFTINAYIDRQGNCLTAIPHQRLVVQNGESVQAKTCHIPTLINLADALIRAIPGLYGPINFQAFHDPAHDTCQLIEVNPRLGGGFPLAHQAKGKFIDWLCRETFDKEPLPAFHDWTRNLLMMRHREALFEIQQA